MAIYNFRYTEECSRSCPLLTISYDLVDKGAGNTKVSSVIFEGLHCEGRFEQGLLKEYVRVK